MGLRGRRGRSVWEREPAPAALRDGVGSPPGFELLLCVLHSFVPLTAAMKTFVLQQVK